MEKNNLLRRMRTSRGFSLAYNSNMIIYLKKFGTVLTSRQAGREAWLAYQPTLASVASDEKIEVDFEGVFSLAPSWADEFFRPLRERFGQRLILLPSDNTSVKASLSMIV